MGTILLIEDNLEIRENIAEMLELENHIVFTAINGLEGMDIAKNKLPELILCDIQMPGANGYEVLSTLKKEPETASIPFIFITANAEKSEIKTGMSLGAFAYISKPFESDPLIKLVNDCLLQQSLMK
jgi:CheY-like chemotaxis protein